MSLLHFGEMSQLRNPLDVVEALAGQHDWPLERRSDAELSISLSGTWCDYHIGFSFNQDYNALQVACAYDLKVGERKRAVVSVLLTMINERLWAGHFDLWTDESVLIFRHTLLVYDDYFPPAHSIELLIDTIFAECERFYPAFQYVIWGGRSPKEALDMALLETAGEA